ncbi:sensor histidine kinase [Blastococcus brunescens]|uniref:Sensor histidine kinase n=1 Tax=Blastococcus brunescens TaxID=1564165 RepID=A0ABZ1AZD1_9ACTN|nr:sensor histidine kinase [Blastococcus sp. BMG 8361]WRL63927.1 sensor histidine kinase [Blastococcus sp. BMG 8361]
MSGVHAGALVASQAELLDVALPFLDAGLRAGDLVALACPPDTVELLTRELGARAAAVESEPRLNLLGSRAPDALTMCARYVERAKKSATGRLRVLSEVDFGDDPADWREGQRFDAVTNRLLGGEPMDIVCVYDRRRLDPSVVDSARATHPTLVDGTGQHANPGFQEPGSYVPSLPLPRAPVEDGAPVCTVEDARTLAGLRHQLGAVIASLVPDRDKQEDLHLAASEIAANAFRHGVRPVSARVWGTGRRSFASSPTTAPPTATRSADSSPRTARTCRVAAWGCGWPGSSGTTWTCCPARPGSASA